MKTYKIFRDGKEVAIFEDQETDLKPCLYIQQNQSQSLTYALRYGGWQVEETDQATGESKFWKVTTVKVKKIAR